MKICVLVYLILEVLPLFAQTEIKGFITDKMDGQAVEAATVSLYALRSNRIIAYTQSGENGEYRILFNRKQDSLTLAVTGFNLKKVVKDIANKSQTIDFVVGDEMISIKEVIVVAPKINEVGDTLNYNVERFTDETDRTLKDVLGKMPGIQVLENGMILYMNKPINRFYIEDMDLLKDRYGIATNNINPNDIATVQVLQKHQPVKALKDYETSSDAAINLKLKKTSKGVVLATAQLGAGISPLLLSNELVGMYFSKKMQDMVVYKGDNSGRDILGELNSLYNPEPKVRDLDILAVLKPRQPAVSLQRYLFNDAHIGTVNHLLALKNRYVLSTNIYYAYDEPKRESNAETDYYLPGDSSLKICEQNVSKLYQNRMGANIELSANTDDFFLKNRVKMEGRWDKENGRVFTGDSIRQHLDNPVYGISNQFEWVTTNERNMFKVASFAGYKDMTQTLDIYPVLYDALLPPATSLMAWMRQKARMKDFTTTNSLTYGRKGKVTQNYSLDFNAHVQHLQTDLLLMDRGIEVTGGDSLANDLKREHYEWKLHVSHSLALGDNVNVHLFCPIRYLLVREQHTSHYLFVDPFLVFEQRLSAYLSSSLNYSFTQEVSGIENAYTGNVMTSYRNLLRNDGERDRYKIHNLWWILGYKSPFSSLFGSFTTFYTHTRARLLSEYLYEGILARKSTLQYPNNTQSLFSSLMLGKDLETIKSSFSLNADYNYNRSLQILQRVISSYKSHSLSVGGKLHTKISRKIILDYKIRGSWNKSLFQETELPVNPVWLLSQQLLFNWLPVEKWMLGVSCEHFYNDAIRSGSRNMWFADLNLSYTLKNTEIRLDCTNLFNTRHYISTVFNETGRYYTEYGLRPGEVLLRVRFKFL